MRAIVVLLAALLAIPGVVLTTAPTDAGGSFTVTTDAPRSFYVQIDAQGGARLQSPAIYVFGLETGESFGRTISAAGPGSVRVRVWASDGGEGPAADQTIALPTRFVYVPLVVH
jgi:hypothetical protein